MKTIFYSGRLPIAACSLLLMLTTTASAEVGPNWIEQWGIRWTFDKNLSLDGAGDTYQYGQFVNGDYWVRNPTGGSVNIISINPEYDVVDSPEVDTSGNPTGNLIEDRIINGSMINPIPGFLQGYDSAASGFRSVLCVNSNVSELNPLEMTADTTTPVQSLVSTISRENVSSKKGDSRIDTAAVLTIVKDVPSADAFRPPYAGDSKPSEITASSINWESLATLQPVQYTPAIADSEGWFQRPWIQHKGTYPGSDIMPVNNMKTYGRDEARVSHTAAALLNLDYSQAQKQTLLYYYLQYGIDIYGIATQHQPPSALREGIEEGDYDRYTGRRIWYGAGGLGIGKRTALVFAAKVLNHQGMINDVLAKQGDYLWSYSDTDGYPDPVDGGVSLSRFPEDYIQFGEEQIFYVRQIHVDLTNNNAPEGWPAWSVDSRASDPTPYSESDIGLPEWGERAAEAPHTTNNSMWHPYRSMGVMNAVQGALILRIMDAVSITNHDAFFDYADRVWQILNNDPEEYATWLNGTNGIDLKSAGPFFQNLWNAYREDYGPVWLNADERRTKQILLTINFDSERGTVTPDSGQYPTGSEVVLYAQANDGYRFVGWGGDETGIEPSVTITMDEDKTILAFFEPIEYAPVAQQLAHLPLTEAINGRVSDLSVNMHTATPAGNVTFESGMGARFDGSDGYLRVADADSLDMQEPMTISVWIWPMGATPFAKLVVKPYAAYASPWEMYALDLGSSGDTPRFIVTDGIAGGRIAVAANSDVKLQTGQWYHLVAVYDGQSIALYLNGSLIAQESVPFQIGTNHEPLCIGGRMGLNTFDGYINDVKIYQGAFTPEQVSGIFSRDRNGGLAGHWLFERPYVDEVTDVVSGQKAELVDQPDWGEGWAAEYFVRLTDGRQAVQIPMDGSTAEAGTIGLWVQPEAATDTETASALQLLFGHAVNSDDNRITLYTVESTDAEGNTVHKLALGLGDNAALQDNIAQLVPGQPYHVALTWDGTTYAVFVDGVRRDAGTFSGLAELEAFADVGNFGTASGRAYASGFRGLVDEIQLYRRALNAEEITRLFLTHTAKENRLIEFAVYGTDDAGSPIYYTAKNLPAGATFDAQKQTFFWRPALYQSAGNYEIVFAADGYPDQKITVSVQDTELAGWYIKFLESRGLH